ncbi:MAG: putative porin [Bacteroidales bacterium]|nr:putative porin [Bacteroidales bacterium]
MKSFFSSLLLFSLLSCSFSLYSQSQSEIIRQDTIIQARDTLISNENIIQDQQEHIHDHDHDHDHPYSPSIAGEINDSIRNPLYMQLDAPETGIDTTKKINFWNITERTGEMITAYPDTFLTDYFNRTNVEGFGISEAYLGNLGLATESRVFFDRKDRSHFIFMDPFYRYAKTPGTFNFINTKIPYSNISYQRAGSRQVREERLQAILAINLGKKLNIGFDVDYLYARGYYESQASKHLEWVFFANYISDRHRLHVFVNPSDYTTAENGGLQNDVDITHPSGDNTLDFATNLQDTWNNLKGGQYYLNYHYNMGFERDSERVDEEGNVIKQFIPVSSIIYTFNLDNKRKRFYSTNKNRVDAYYPERDSLPHMNSVNDSTSYWNMSNTLGLSLREGFSEWAKFDLTAFITQDFRSYTMMDTTINNYEKDYSATYIGGELAKRSGDIFRYNTQASFGVLGYNLGDMDLSGNIETRIPVWGDTASISAYGSIKNIEPTFYENHYHSKYFWWDKDFSKVKKVRFGGDIHIPHTNTNFGLGVENISNYLYFDKDGMPTQHNSDIQIITAILKQDFQYRALHWDNRLVYQKTSNSSILPLPDFTAYTSLYVQFKIAKVLTVQMGANAHYWTEYYAPSYEPATQQFKLQDMTSGNAVKVGNYPLISGFINCHLKQTRFFIQYYNAGAQFINPPEYFSLPHYPVNPSIVKLGLSVDFIN